MWLTQHYMISVAYVGGFLKLCQRMSCCARYHATNKALYGSSVKSKNTEPNPSLRTWGGSGSSVKASGSPPSTLMKPLLRAIPPSQIRPLQGRQKKRTRFGLLQSTAYRFDGTV